MATYVIGDIQGCFLTFQKLLNHIKFTESKDQLILLGDVINRGPRSLETLRFIKAHASSMAMVLGNHEIFAIALCIGAFKGSRGRPHTLKGLLEAPDQEELITWLRHQPLMIKRDSHIFIHAGILPAISIEEAYEASQQLSGILASDQARDFLHRFYEKTPTVLKPSMGRKKTLRLSLAYFTLLRMCETSISMDLSYNGTIDKAPKRLRPWFLLRNDAQFTVYFGHWAALGLYHRQGYHCLDSGCVWGQKLSAMRLEDQQVFQVANCEARLDT